MPARGQSTFAGRILVVTTTPSAYFSHSRLTQLRETALQGLSD